MENTWTGFTLLRTGSAVFGAGLESYVNRAVDGSDGAPDDERHTFIIPISALLEAGISATADTIVIYWQLHESRNPGAANAPSSFIANTDEGATAYWIKLTAAADGSFQIVNGRTGFSKSYSQKPRQDPH